MSARRLHKTLAWVAGVVAVLWAATGFLHPVMSWTAPRAAVQAPPVGALDLQGVLPPAPLLAAHSLEETTLVRLVMIDEAPVWLATDPKGPERLALDARTGELRPDAERRHAEALARHYADLPDTEISSAQIITVFSTTYPSVNRLLPIWEVRFDTPDGLTLYVDTGMDRLAAVTNDQRRVLLSVFQNIHTLKFLETVEPLRLALILALVGTVVATTVFGAMMLWRARGRGLYRFHTMLAWIALPLVLMFTLSGLFHLIVTNNLSPAAPPSAAPFAVASLPAPPSAAPGIAVDHLAATAGGWRIEAGGRGFYLDPAVTDQSRARDLAGANQTASVSLVTRFGGDYSFINKRLPVWRVEGADGLVFVDVREGLIAGAHHADPVKALEGWSFDNLHKWEFLNPIGRRNRDYATMAATAIIILTAGFGIALLLRRRRTT
jgi:hypothetical protein